MSTIGTLLVRLGVDTKPLTAGMATAKADVEGFGKSTSATAANVAKGVGLAGAAVAGGVGIIGVESIKAATDYQSAMELLRTQTGASQAEVDSMSKSVLNLATQLPQSPEELAAGLYHVESAGKRGADALNILKTAAMGAAMGGANLEDVTNALIAADQTGIKGTENMSATMGTLNAIVGAGNMRMQDLTDAMGTGVLSTAKNYGVTIQSVGAAIADMTDQGIPAIDAATRLNSAMRLMAAPTTKAAKELKSIGLSQFQLASDMRGPGGMTSAIEDLKKHLDASGMSANQQAALIASAFGGKQSGAILTLIGNVDLLQKKTDAVAKGASSFASGWQAAQGTTAQQAAELKSSFQALEISIGTGLLPAVNGIMKVVSPVINAIAHWAIANPKLASMILMIVGGLGALTAAVFLLGPAIGGLAGIFAILTSPILLIVGAIAGFILIASRVPSILAPFKAVLGDLGSLFNALVATIGPVVSALIGVFQGTETWTTALAKIQMAFQVFMRFIGLWVGQIGRHLLALAQAFIDWVAPMIPKVLAALAAFAGQIINWVAAQVPGWIGAIAGWAKAFIDWVAPMIPPLLAMLGNFASQIIRWVAAQAPVWFQQLLKWADAFVAWVLPMIPPAIAALGQLLGQLIAWVAAQVPIWVAQLGAWAEAFMAWIDPLIPKALAMLGNFASQIIRWVAAQAPVWFQQLLKWADAFVAWVLPMIPPLLANLAKFGVSLLGWIIKQLPVIGAALLRMAAEFVVWILPKIPGMLVNLAKWAASVVAGVIGAIPSMVVALGRMALSFVGWIVGIVPQTIVALGSWLASILRWLAGIPGRVYTAAWNIGASIAHGIINAIANLPKLIGNTLSKIPGAGLISDLFKNLPHFQTGAENVPQTMLAIVHQGEMILPVDQARQLRTAAGKATGAPAQSLAAAAARVGGGVPAPAAGGSDVASLTAAIIAAIRQAPLVGQMTINNPQAEPAGVSIANQLRVVSAMGLGSPALPVPAAGVGSR
jgi:TP901 family phage tail tape measure protein